MLSIGIIGSGNIGRNIGARAAQAGRAVIFSFSRDPVALARFAATQPNAIAGTPADAARSDIIVLATPWALIDEALDQAGTMVDKIVIDTTNPYTSNGLDALAAGKSTGTYNAERMPGTRLVKAFNTLTAGFQAEAGDRPARTAMFFCGDDQAAKAEAAALIEIVGFQPIDLGSLADGQIMDAPRRDGAVYGEAYTAEHAHQIAVQLRDNPSEAALLAQNSKA